MSRFSRIALAVLIAAFSLLGLGLVTENIRVPEPISRLLVVSPASGQPARTAQPSNTDQTAATATAPSGSTSPTATELSIAAPTTMPATADGAATLQPASSSANIPTHTVELVGPRAFRISDPSSLTVELRLTTMGKNVPGVTADIFGLESQSGATFWPIYLHSPNSVTVTAGIVTTLIMMNTVSGTMLPPFGTFTGALRVNVASDETESYSVTLEFVPEDWAELLVDVEDPVHLNGDAPIEIRVAARYNDAKNVQARVTQLVDSASQPLPAGFIVSPTRSEAIDKNASQTIALELDPNGLKSTLRGGEVYTATVLLTADNAPTVVRKVRLNVAGPGAVWRLETPRVTPRFGSDWQAVAFDLWFTAQGGVQAAEDTLPELTLTALTDRNGRSILADTTPIAGTQLEGHQDGLLDQGWNFEPRFASEPLSQGVYTGVVRLVMEDVIQPITFTLEVPQRDLTLALPKGTDGTSQVKLSFVRLLPCSLEVCSQLSQTLQNWVRGLFGSHNSDGFWSIGSRELYLAPEIGFSRPESLVIPPANLVKPQGGLGQIMFQTMTATPTATPTPTVTETPTAESASGVAAGPVEGQIRTATPTPTAGDFPGAAAGWPVMLSLSGVGATGIYTGVTEIRAPDLASPKPLNVTVVVTDLLVWPFLFIGLGVVVSAWLSRRLNPETNPEYQRLRNEELRKKIELLGSTALRSLAFLDKTLTSYPTTKDLDKDVQQTVAEAETQLKESNERIADGRLTEAIEKRGKAEQELAKLDRFVRILEIWKRTGPLSQESQKEVRESLRKAWISASTGDLVASDSSINEARGKLNEPEVTGETDEIPSQPMATPPEFAPPEFVYPGVDLKFRIRVSPKRPHARDRVSCQLEIESSPHVYGPVPEIGLSFHWTVYVKERLWTRRRRRAADASSELAAWSWIPDTAGKYIIECMEETVSSHRTNSTKISVNPSLLELASRAYRKNQKWATAGTFLIASLAGVAYVVFVNPTFGTFQEYLLAFLWGAGVDQARRGMPGTVTPVLRRFSDWLKGEPDPKASEQQNP